MLSACTSPKRSPRLSVPLDLPPSSLELICLSDDNCSNDDFESMKTTDTFNQPYTDGGLKERKSIEIDEKEQRNLKNLCQSIKQKEAVIGKLNLQLQILTEENKILKGLTGVNQKSVLSKQNITVDSVEQKPRIRYFELLIRQKDEEVQELVRKNQQEINLFYSNSNNRLKLKEVECYNTSKQLKEEIARNKHLVDKSNYLKAENEKLQDSLNYFYKQKSKIIQEREKAYEQLKRAEVAISRLKYCESQLKYLNDQYFKEKDSISKINGELQLLKQQNQRLSYQLEVIRKRNQQPYQLSQKVMTMESEMNQLKKGFRIKEEQLKSRIRNSEQLLEQQNNHRFLQELHQLNQSYKGKIF